LPSATAFEFRGPDVYDMPVDTYHADPVPGGSLSSTGARKLLSPSCPAHFKQWLDDGQETKRAWDIGHAAHKLVLGAGPKLELVDKARWDTNEVKAKLAAIRERGDVPLKKPDFDTVEEMAAAIRRHPVASALFDPATGQPERALIWRDPQTGVMCRALVDFLRHPGPGRFLLPDYKSTGTKYGASPDKIGRTIADFGYHLQLAFYLMGCRALGLAGEDAEALLVIQETAKPYLVTVAQPDPTAMRMGAIYARRAIDLFAECRKSGEWPGYSDDVVLAELPPWETKELKGEVW
jgi:hypothetical protein